MLSPVFLVSRFNRHSGDSDLVLSLFFLFFQRFRVEHPSLGPTANSEPSSDRCTRALASCMDDPNFGITTVATPLGILDFGFHFGILATWILHFFCLPCLFTGFLLALPLHALLFACLYLLYLLTLLYFSHYMSK